MSLILPTFFFGQPLSAGLRYSHDVVDQSFLTISNYSLRQPQEGQCDAACGYPLSD
jgi:hypothetical protein